MMMATVIMDDEGGVTLPQDMLDALGWTAGMDLIVEDEEAGVLVRPPSEDELSLISLGHIPSE